MSFWQLSNGQKPTGEEKDAFTSDFALIPNGTKAPGKIKKFFINDSWGTPFISIHWQLLEGEYANRIVFQKINVMDEKPEKSDKAKNMLMLIFKLLGFTPTHANMPTDADLSTMIGKVLGIKILEYHTKDGKEGNYVGEVHIVDDSFVVETGHSPVDSALSRNSRVASFGDPIVDDAIPF